MRKDIDMLVDIDTVAIQWQYNVSWDAAKQIRK
jgi:hypothetical protein